MTHTTDRVDTTVVFRRLLNDYADCLRNGDFQDAGAAFVAVVAEYQQAARRAPVVSAVQMPEPAGWLHRHPEECKDGEVCDYRVTSADRKYGWEEFPLYTEQQMRTLLSKISTQTNTKNTTLAQEGWKLVQIELLERIQESLGSFLSDQGWSQSDMDTADALGGLLAAAPQPPACNQSMQPELATYSAQTRKEKGVEQ